MLLDKPIPLSYIAKITWKKLLVCVFIAGSISYFDEYFESWGLKFPIVELSITALLGTSITLILAFRINQSYDRWWEARKIWGGVVNDSRNFIREVSNLHNPKADELELKRFRNEMIRGMLAWCNALKHNLRKTDNSSDLGRYYSQSEIDEFYNFDQNLPSAILFNLMRQLKEAHGKGLVNDFQQVRITETINNLSDMMGKAERIKSTVFPKLYSTLIDFGIWCFVTLLPIAYRDPNKYVEFPVVMSIAAIFFTLEELAINLQDPFENRPTDISMSAIVRKIEIFGLSAMETEEVPEEMSSQKFYLM